MTRTLAVGVIVRHPDSAATVFLPSGSDLPGWAAGLVGDHALTDSGAPEPAPGADAAQSQPDPAATDKLVLSPDGMRFHQGDREAVDLWVSPPPQAGPGSSRSRWAKYATARGVTVADDTSREGIIAACVAAGVPVS